jgi:hypothetical protein
MLKSSNTQSYDLTWYDSYLILSSTLLPEDRCRVWDADRAHADEIHHTILAHPVEATAIPTEEPHWDYQKSGRMLRDQMVTCLVAGLKKAAQKVINFNKLREIQQKKKKRKIQLVSCPGSQRCYNTIQKLTLKLRMGQSFL